MKKGKFEKKLLKADTEDLCEMLLRKLNENPFASDSSKNRMIYEQLPEEVRDGLLDMFYEQINGMICEARKSRMSFRTSSRSMPFRSTISLTYSSL